MPYQLNNQFNFNFVCSKCGCTTQARCYDSELGYCWQINNQEICSNCLKEELIKAGKPYTNLIEDSLYWYGEAGLK